MPGRLLPAALNHLLAREEWALARLKPFAGQHARFEWGLFGITVAIANDGLLVASDTSRPAAVTIRLPADAPVRLAIDPAATMTAAHISGAADFAEVLGFVARNLRWDAEADLALLTGDIAARRLVSTAKAMVRAQGETATRIGANVVEYAADEAGWIIRPAPLARFAGEVAQLAGDISRLEARIGRLR